MMGLLVLHRFLFCLYNTTETFVCTKLSHDTDFQYPLFVMHLENENAAHNSREEGKIKNQNN